MRVVIYKWPYGWEGKLWNSGGSDFVKKKIADNTFVKEIWISFPKVAYIIDNTEDNFIKISKVIKIKMTKIPLKW